MLIEKTKHPEKKFWNDQFHNIAYKILKGVLFSLLDAIFEKQHLLDKTSRVLISKA
jgi:hypothetical protein